MYTIIVYHYTHFPEVHTETLGLHVYRSRLRSVRVLRLDVRTERHSDKQVEVKLIEEPVQRATPLGLQSRLQMLRFCGLDRKQMYAPRIPLGQECSTRAMSS